jgi:hypothetical protein
MICGWQIACGDWVHPMAFCAKRKAHGLPACQDHWEEAVADGATDFAPGNARGERHLAVRLLWEGEDASIPVEASADEMALYASILT